MIHNFSIDSGVFEFITLEISYSNILSFEVIMFVIILIFNWRSFNKGKNNNIFSFICGLQNCPFQSAMCWMVHVSVAQEGVQTPGSNQSFGTAD